MKLNKTTAMQIEVPRGKSEIVVFDDDIPGFGLRVRTGGSRIWIFQYRVGRKQRRLSFGPLATLTAQKARERAIQLHAQVKLGDDPAGQKIESRARASEIFEQALRPFLARQKERLKPRSYIEVERHLLMHAKKLHWLQLAKIDRRTIAGRLAEITTDNGPTAANRVRASLSAFFAWAVREGLVDTNPVINTNKAVEGGARHRVLSKSELRQIWEALPDDNYGAIVKLLALTGQRRDEIGGLRWSEVDLDNALISLPAERTKNKKPHDIALSPPAFAILKRRGGGDGEYVFGKGAKAGYQGWSNSKELLDQRMITAGNTIPDWHLHDLRRTFSTVAHDELGAAPHVVEAALNHISGHRAGVSGVYNKAVYAREKAALLARWADYLIAIVEEREPKVLAFQAPT